MPTSKYPNGEIHEKNCPKLERNKVKTGRF